MAKITTLPAKKRSGRIVRTAVYIRVSSCGNEQKRYYTELLRNSTGAVPAGLYADEKSNGTSTAKRTEFQRLMSDCRKGKIDRIVTKSVSQLSGNIMEYLETIRELKALGISVCFEKEDIDMKITESELIKWQKSR